MSELNLIREEENIRAMALSTETVVTHDVSEEFSLPDYVPEIRRLLNVRAQVLPESKYIADKGSGSNLEFAGTVTYLLIYTDDEGNLCSLPLSSSYEAEASLVSHPSIVLIDTSVDSLSSRVNAPRKITIKSRLKSKISGWENASYTENTSGKSTAEEMMTQRLTKEENVMSLQQISMQNIRVSDKLDTQGEENLRPLWCDATAYVTDARVQNGSVSVRGEMRVRCLCKKEDGYITLTKDVPLAEEIEAQGYGSGDSARVSARCVSLSISNEEREDGDTLFFDLNCELEGEIIRMGSMEITVDSYSTKYETEEEYKTVQLYSLLKTGNDSFTVKEGIKRKNTDMAELIDIICDPVCEKAEFKGGKCILSGKVNITAIGLSSETEEQEKEGMAESYELPFKYVTETKKSNGECVARWDVLLGDINAKLEGEKLSVDMELYPSYEIFERTKAEILDTSTVKRDKEIKKDLSCVRAYFPQVGESLWDIAKKYHTTMSAIKDSNDLSSDTLDIAKALII